MSSRRFLCGLCLAAFSLAACEQSAPMKSSTAKPVAPAALSSTSSTVAPKPPEPVKEVLTRLEIAPAEPASASEVARAAVAAISKHIDVCWQGPEAVDAPAVTLQLNLNQDGSVLSISVLDKKSFATNPAYRAAAREATGAFFKCSPFVLPVSSYAGWKSLALRITPHH
jgi:hypothetical protein